MKKFRVCTDKLEEKTTKGEIWTADDILLTYNSKTVTGISANDFIFETIEEARAEYERRCENASTALESGYSSFYIVADVITLQELEFEDDDIIEICLISEFAKDLS